MRKSSSLKSVFSDSDCFGGRERIDLLRSVGRESSSTHNNGNAESLCHLGGVPYDSNIKCKISQCFCELKK